MKPRRRSSRFGLAAAAVSIFSLLGCGSNPNPLHPTGSEQRPGGPETDALIAALQREGAIVVRAEELSEASFPCFSAPALRLLVDASNVYVWEYATPAKADQVAASVSPSGYSVAMCHFDWISTPHFFKRSRLIVLYVGASEPTIGLLTRLLGPSFAGG